MFASTKPARLLPKARHTTTSSDTVEYIAPTDDFNHGPVSKFNENSPVITMVMDIRDTTIGEDVQDVMLVRQRHRY